MSEEIKAMVHALKYQIKKEVCAKYRNCKGCPIKDSLKVDLCDAVFLFDQIKEPKD